MLIVHSSEDIGAMYGPSLNRALDELYAHTAISSSAPMTWAQGDVLTAQFWADPA